MINKYSPNIAAIRTGIPKGPFPLYRLSFMFCSIASMFFLNFGCASTGRQIEPTYNISLPAVDSFQLRRDILQAYVDSVLADSLLYQANRSVYIISLNSGKEIYSLNKSSLLVPASVNKLFVTAAAYRLLGINCRFRTSVYGDSAGPSGVIKGNLYIKGFGDPVLRTADLEAMAYRLRAMGLRMVRGNLVADAGYFDTTSYGLGWMWDEGPYAYNAPISALSLNRNTFEIGLRPGIRPGRRPAAELNPKTGYLRLDNRAVTVKAGTNAKIKADRSFDGNGDMVSITGTMAVDRGMDYLVRTVTNPPLYCGNVFKEILAANGIKITGDVLLEETPPDMPELTWHVSPPLHQIIREMDKESDNFIAEMLYRQLNKGTDSMASDSSIKPDRLAEMLRGFGFGEQSFRLADGSGLSRYNLCSSAQLVKVLSEVYNDHGLRSELLSSLPVAGIDGTMARRLNAEEYKGMIRAKTGTLTGVSSLAGFAFGPDNKTYCFAIMFNNYTSKANSVRALQDSIVARLLRTAP